MSLELTASQLEDRFQRFGHKILPSYEARIIIHIRPRSTFCYIFHHFICIIIVMYLAWGGVVVKALRY
jgi:hypothetical protein